MGGLGEEEGLGWGWPTEAAPAGSGAHWDLLKLRSLPVDAAHISSNSCLWQAACLAENFPEPPVISG